MSEIDDAITELKQTLNDAVRFIGWRMFYIMLGGLGIACNIPLKYGAGYLPPLEEQIYRTAVPLGCLITLWQIYRCWNWYWSIQSEN